MGLTTPSDESRIDSSRPAAGSKTWRSTIRTEEQIVDPDVARYCERILREPRGANWLWSILVPLASIVLATAGLVLFLSRQLKQPALVAATAADL